jgi:hypothetical protein
MSLGVILLSGKKLIFKLAFIIGDTKIMMFYVAEWDLTIIHRGYVVTVI